MIVSWGGGTNSTAMLIEMHDRQMRPDLILFADTGGEKPHTYQFIPIFSRWLHDHDFPEILIVSNDGIYKTLENNCLTKKMLPSLAYGFKSCSDKYKRRPQEKFAKTWEPAVKCWEAGGKVTKVLGIDAGEAHRAAIQDDKLYRYTYPLIEWNWDREDCERIITEAGLPQPGKSACFYCPASKKKEIRELKQVYPELFDRAIAMEKNAKLTDVKGLGRRFSWEDYINADEAQGRLFPEVFEAPCMCVD